jgi:hypothetical protein
MIDKSGMIFGNAMKRSVVRKAVRAKKNFLREFGDDSEKKFTLGCRDIPELAGIGAKLLTVMETGASGSDRPFESAGEKPLVVGTIRMGFGHYRISIAIASAARSMGFTPYFFDLHSFRDLTAGKIVAKQNALYSMGSRLSQKSALFNRLVWEPLNSEGFRKLSYNAIDQKTAELMATPCALLPRDIPFVATHVWPAQAAVHAGLSNVVNAIPDNWPMALHLSEGAIHTVQTKSSWFGYATLNGMDGDKILSPMPEGSVVYTGHYIDHELVAGIGDDTAARLKRLSTGEPLRVLLTVGGAGAQRELYAQIIAHLLPLANAGELALFVNVGDHKAVLEGLLHDVPGLEKSAIRHGGLEEVRAFAESAMNKPVPGAHLFCDPEIFAAVYATNLLMRAADLLVTKPSELAFYPIPKLHVKRVGGHEAWGAIHSAEIGDGTIECPTPERAIAMLDFLFRDRSSLTLMNDSILAANAIGLYSGAYRAVELAAHQKQ